MAFTLSLIKRDDFTVDISSLVLTGYTQGIDLAEGAWIPGIAGDEDEEVEEVLNLRIKSNSVDGLATILQNLSEKIKEVGNFKDDVEQYGVWLKAQLVGETNSRYALITRAGQKAITPFAARQVEAGYFVKEYQLGLVRTPWWEATGIKLYQPTELNLVGGVFNYTTYVGSPGVVVGDTAARIAYMKIKGHASSSTNALQKFWFGFRSPRFGTLANFQSYWSLRKGIGFGADTTGGLTNVDATAKDGYKTITTFATTPALSWRVDIRVRDITANYTDQRGSYTVLLRAKNSAAGTVRVRMEDGFYYSAGYRTQARVSISSSSWQFYELGTVRIPSPGRLINGISDTGEYRIRIDAERISGGCALEMDCLVMIPNNEGYIFSDGCMVYDTVQDTRIVQSADGRNFSVEYIGTWEQKVGKPRVFGGLPLGNGIVVAAGQQPTVSVLADHVDLDINVYNRWAVLRGAE